MAWEDVAVSIADATNVLGFVQGYWSLIQASFNKDIGIEESQHRQSTGDTSLVREKQRKTRLSAGLFP